MRVIFMGTPDFALPCLEALAKAGHEIVAVYSQPPRKSGRGHQHQLSPVHAFAQSHGWSVYTPTHLKTSKAQNRFVAHKADVAIVMAYGLILPQSILDTPSLGCLNVHASFLPRWRGAAPIQRAIEAGDTQSGVCLIQMDAGLDTGPVVACRPYPIASDATGQSLHDALAVLGAELLVETLAAGKWQTRPQASTGITYAHKLGKGEGKVDWSLPAEVLERRIRAFTPWPGTWCDWQGQRLKIITARLEPGSGSPGQILDDQLLIACGQSALRLTQVQRQGKTIMDAKDFLRGNPVIPGTYLS